MSLYGGSISGTYSNGVFSATSVSSGRVESAFNFVDANQTGPGSQVYITSVDALLVPYSPSVVATYAGYGIEHRTDGTFVYHPLINSGGSYYLEGAGQLDGTGFTYGGSPLQKSYEIVADSLPAGEYSETTLRVPCYASGTRIRTAGGDVAVESLRVGDVAITSSGRHAEIRWIGHNTTHCAGHAEPTHVWPVRISAGALGPGAPVRDLFVSPGHGICLDVMGEVLVPAHALVNGATVTQVTMASVTYWHVELDRHDILLAEGQPAESYLNVGNRAFFDQGTGQPDPDPAEVAATDTCVPLHGSGPVVEVIQTQLRRRAISLGWRLHAAPHGDVHLTVDGVRVDPVVDDLVLRFALPPGCREVWLESEAGVPCHAGPSADQRRLGLAISGLSLGGIAGISRAIALDDPLLCVGFHPVEAAIAPDAGPFRWTTGRARLPAALFTDPVWKGPDGPTVLTVTRMNDLVIPHWLAPAGVPQHRVFGEASLAGGPATRMPRAA